MTKNDSFEALTALDLPEGAVISIIRHGYPYIYEYHGRGEWYQPGSGILLDKDWLSHGFRIVHPAPSREEVVEKFVESAKARAQEWDEEWSYDGEAKGLGKILSDVLDEAGL